VALGGKHLAGGGVNFVVSTETELITIQIVYGFYRYVYL